MIKAATSKPVPVLSLLEGERSDAASRLIGVIPALDEKIPVSTRRSLTWGMPHGQGLDDAPLKVTKFIPAIAPPPKSPHFPYWVVFRCTCGPDSGTAESTLMTRTEDQVASSVV